MSASQAEHGGSIPLTCSIEKAPESLKSKVSRGFFLFSEPPCKNPFRAFLGGPGGGKLDGRVEPLSFGRGAHYTSPSAPVSSSLFLSTICPRTRPTAVPIGENTTVQHINTPVYRYLIFSTASRKLQHHRALVVTEYGIKEA